MSRVKPTRAPTIAKPRDWTWGQGSVVPLFDGRFRAVLTVKGKRFMREAKSEDRAWELLRQLREEHAGTAITTDQFLEAWIAEPGRRPKTLRAYSFAIGLVRGSLAGIPLKELRVADIQKALNIRRKDGQAYSASVVNRVREVLRSALNVAVARDVIPKNPAAGRGLRLPKVTWEGFTAWSQEEAERFLKVMKGQPLECWFTIALTNGLRMSEISGIQWADINLDKRTLKVRHQVEYPSGKLVPLKTRSIRTVGLHQRVVELLGKSGEGFVFVGSTHHPVQPTVIRRALARGIKTAGVPRISVHGLRHTALTVLAAHGVDALTLQRMAGHSSITTTMRYIDSSQLDKRGAEIVRAVWK